MIEREFQINGVNFKLNKVDAFKQFHIVRRMGPLLGELLPAMKTAAVVSGKKEMSEDEKFDSFAEIASPLFAGLAKLSDKDSEFILTGLLEAVEMQQDNGGWARLATNAGLMFNNIELPLMLQVAGRALMFNIGNFFAILPSALPGAKSKQKGRSLG